MQDLAALAALYAELDAYLEGLRFDAAGRADEQGVERVKTRQRLNDQAYFVLC